MKMAIADSWAELLSALLLVVAAIYGMREYSEHKSGVQVEQMERLYDVFDSPAMVARRSGAAAQPGKFSRDAHEVFLFFEKVARWEEKGLINVEDLQYYFQDALLLYWHVWEPAIKDIRRSEGQNPNTGDLYQGVQRIVERMERELGVKPPSDAQLKEWLEFERQRAVPSSAPPEVEKGTARSEQQGS